MKWMRRGRHTVRFGSGNKDFAQESIAVMAAGGTHVAALDFSPQNPCIAMTIQAFLM